MELWFSSVCGVLCVMQTTKWAYRCSIHFIVTTNFIKWNLAKPKCIMQCLDASQHLIMYDVIYLDQWTAKNVAGMIILFLPFYGVSPFLASIQIAIDWQLIFSCKQILKYFFKRQWIFIVHVTNRKAKQKITKKKLVLNQNFTSNKQSICIFFWSVNKRFSLLYFSAFENSAQSMPLICFNIIFNVYIV